MGGGKFCSSGFCAARHSNFARDPSWTYNCSKVLFESESPAWIRKIWYEIKRSKTYETHQYVSLNMWKHAFVMVIKYEQYLKKMIRTVTCFVFLSISHGQDLSSFQCFFWENITFWNKILLKVVLHSRCNYNIFDRIVQRDISSAQNVIKEIYHKMYLCWPFTEYCFLWNIMYDLRIHNTFENRIFEHIDWI